MIKIGIHGSTGRMGRMIIENLKGSDKAVLSVAHAIEPFDFELPKDTIVTDSLDVLFANCDIVIDFTIKVGAVSLLNYARTNPKPIVMGTTGLGVEGVKLLEQASNLMPILYATNMSLGVAVLNNLATIAAKALGDFDIEIVEQHHRHKKDSPSGTAMTLAQCAAKARNLDLEKVRISGRDGLIGERSKDEIAVMALRGGDVVGRHRIGFYNDGEYIEIEHTATSRSTFAKGAIKAAVWLHGKENGLYSINDCLGLK